ncbi:MAG: 6,7-dimethyl-8-ribityllumazine synthase [Ignavibacteria bacterium]|nr:6,7-dimethyl-8-ribityllumazine synthase [Ignavibacteria bacterium]
MGRKKIKIAIAVSKFNEEVTSGLLKGAMNYLEQSGIEKNQIKIFYVPGAFEIPITVKKLSKTKKYHGIICLGAVIKGETAHFEYISYAVTHGLIEISLKSDTPIGFGVITCYTEEQALARSSDNENNKGSEAAKAVIEMIEILDKID